MAQEHELKFVLSSSAQGLEQGMKAAARALETLGKELGELKKELDKSDAALDGLDASQRETAAATDQATAAIRNQSGAQREAIRSTEQMAREQELQTKEIVAGVAAIGTIIAAYKGLQQAVSVAIDAYVDQRNSLVGLRSIAEGTGNSMASLEADLVKLTKSGLIPMADAATALKNLLSRGYTADQAVAVIERLTDAAAFGRQANLDLGEAVRTASDGLRNENSILVDNAGITKNVAKMWADYADQIGVSVNELTMAQKIQAEYNGIMEESKHQVGDAAKLAEEYSGSQAHLEASLQRVKVAFGEAAAEGVKPYVDVVGDLTTGVADVLEKNRTLTAVLVTAARMFATTGIAVGGATVAISAFTGGAAASIPVIGTLAKAVIGLKTAMRPLPLIIATVVGIGSAIFAGMSASAKQAEEDLQALREEALMMGDAFVQNSAAVAEYEQLNSKGTRATAQEKQTERLNDYSEDIID